MMLYSLALFLHVGSALALASALSIDGLILFQLRRVRTAAAAHPWLNLWSVVPRIAGGSGLLLLLSGAYLAHRMSAWTLAWPKIALAALIVIAVLGVITGKRMRALRQVCASGEATEFEYATRLKDPVLRVSLCSRIALLFAAVLLYECTTGVLGIACDRRRISPPRVIAAVLIPSGGADSLTTNVFARS
jgi:hypothetical protein